MPNEQFFNLYHGRVQATFWRDDDDICFVQDEHAVLDFYRASSSLNNYPWKSNKYQIHSLWFDLTDARTQFYRTWGENANDYTTDAVLSELLGRLDMYPICGRTGVFSVVGA